MYNSKLLNCYLDYDYVLQLFLDALNTCGQSHVRNVVTGPRGLSLKSVQTAEHY